MVLDGWSPACARSAQEPQHLVTRHPGPQERETRQLCHHPALLSADDSGDDDLVTASGLPALVTVITENHWRHGRLMNSAVIAVDPGPAVDPEYGRVLWQVCNGGWWLLGGGLAARAGCFRLAGCGEVGKAPGLGCYGIDPSGPWPVFLI